MAQRPLKKRRKRSAHRAAPTLPFRPIWILALVTVLVVLGIAAWLLMQDRHPTFDGERAFAHVEQQVAFGPRIPGTEGHAQARQYFMEELERTSWRVAEMPFTYVTPDTTQTLQGFNIFASFGPETHPRVMLAAHYDTRPEADRDPNPELRDQPVPGANDGASGVAVLLEMARLFGEEPPPVGVDIVLFDLEDLGEYDSDTDPTTLPFAIGSEVFVAENPGYRPSYGVLVDMVGDRNLRIPREAFSVQYAPGVVERIWRAAERVGADAFIDEQGGAVFDDHVPFLRRGIPVANIIHQPFPDTWHTTRDTPEYVRAESLQQVGDVLVELIYGGR